MRFVAVVFLVVCLMSSCNKDKPGKIQFVLQEQPLI